MVAKKDGSGRLCVDYRALNNVTVKDAMPLPNIQTSIDYMSGAYWFSGLDLLTGYWQIMMRREDQAKTAFMTSKGLYEYTVMPMGCSNAPATFQRIMERILRGLQWTSALLYIDDIIIFSKTVNDHLLHLEQVFTRLIDAGMKLKPSKCSLFKKQLLFLGHIVSGNGVQPNPEKVKAIQDWPTPKYVKETKSFTATCGYYRRFVKNFANIAEPLLALERGNAKFVWNDDTQKAFDTLKNCLISEPILSYPMDEGEWILDTDASDVALGAVLSQIQNGEEKPIAYFSRTLQKAERNYCVTRRELLGVRDAIRHFKHYIYGTNFTVRTDHSSLKWLINYKDPQDQVARWLLELSCYNFRVIHRPGDKHGNADGLSRPICKQCKQKVDDIEEITPGSEFTVEFPVQPREAEALVKKSNKVVTNFYIQKLKWMDTTNFTRYEDGILVNSCAYINSMTCENRLCECEGDCPKSNKHNTQQQSINQTEVKVDQANRPRWTHKYIRDEQRKYKPYEFIIDWLIVNPHKKPTTKDIRLVPLVKQWLVRWELLEIHGEILKIKWINKDGTYQLKTLVPPDLRKDILHEYHGSLLSGHLSKLKCKDKLVQSPWYWIGLKKDFNKHIDKCEECQKFKSPTVKKVRTPPKQDVSWPLAPLERVAMDIIGPLPTTTHGNKFILVIGDYHSRYMTAYALPDQRANTVVKAFHEYQLTEGFVNIVHTDQGTNFMSEYYNQYCEMTGSKHTNTCAFRPMSDGLVERFNRTLKDMLACFCSENQISWDMMLKELCFAYNSSRHSTTDVTPFELFKGRKPFNDPEFCEHRVPEGTPNREAALETLMMRMHRVREYAAKHVTWKLIRQKRYYDKDVKYRSLHIGQAVWYYRPNRKIGVNPKLSTPWDGPFVIISKYGDYLYRIQKTQNDQPIVTHLDKLKPARINTNRFNWYFSTLSKHERDRQVEIMEGKLPETDLDETKQDKATTTNDLEESTESTPQKSVPTTKTTRRQRKKRARQRYEEQQEAVEDEVTTRFGRKVVKPERYAS
jgi:hypothetical protein